MPFGCEKLVFEDTFETLNKDVWSLRNTVPAPDTLSVGSWDSVRIVYDKLRLFAKPQPDGTFLNGHVGTQGTFEFTYGYAEARMKFHPYKGSHSAFWLQAAQSPYTPKNSEIDIAEYFGLSNPERSTPANLWNNVYYRDDITGPILGVKKYEEDTLATRWSNDFHTYGCLWTTWAYKFYVDGVQVNQINAGLSNTPKFLVLSMITRDFEAPDFRYDMTDTYKLMVDYVRVWQ